MRVPRISRLPLLLAVAAAGLSQGEDEPYFALFSSKTFGPGGKPSVEVSSYNVDALEFRVYRVNDPVQFFTQIEAPHEFGGHVPRPPREPNLLERIHSWKHDLRTDIRLKLRAQFTEPPSNHISAIHHTAAQPLAPSAGTPFAVAPVLNPEQLVLKFVQPVLGASRWQRETIPVNIRDKGFYLVEAVRGELRAYTLLMISDITLVTKTGKGRLTNLVVNRTTGEPVAGAKIWMLTRDQSLNEATTNNDGVAELPIKDARPSDIRVIGRSGKDFAVNALAQWSFAANQAQMMGMVYTDRPVYRPGHTVHFRAILRQREPSGYSVPAGKQVSVEINDAESKPVYQKMLAVSPSGVIHDEFTLAPIASLGDYNIQVKSDDNFVGGNFEVQEYKKPEYEVRVLPAKSRVLQGEKVQVTIDTRYYFGEPVSGAKVQWAVYRDRYYFPTWYDPDEQFSPAQAGQDDDNPGDQLDQGEGELDADGKLNIQVETALSEHKWDYMYRVEARVTDQAKREISGRGWILAAYGSFLLNVSPERYFYQPGSKAGLVVQARDYDNKPVAARAHVELLGWNRRTRAETDLKASTDVDIGADGSGTAHVDLPRQGDTYRARVTAKTPEGRDVEAYTYLWVSGGSLQFEDGNENTLTLVPDKRQYRAGETAHVMVVTGKPNTPVYVSIEGRDLRQWRLVRSPETTVTFDVPMTAQDEPGVTVTASFIRKGTFYSGIKYLKVPPVEHQLNVKLATDKPQYLPGQTAEYSIDVTGSDGKPVPRAEFSLGVVDEAIYAIARDTTADPIEAFYGSNWNVVSTEVSLDYYFSGEAGKRRMRLAELRPHARLAQLKPDRLVQPKVRKAFPDTAFWAADLVTDTAGHARAKVDYPDSLTTWRATARGATMDTKVGAGTMKTIVRKNLILRLAVPRFFVQGDELVISALVQNYLANTKTARVSLEVKGLDVLDGSTKDVEIPSRGVAKVDWRVRAQQVPSATVTGKALTDEESDALEMELPIDVPGVKLSQSRGGALATGASAAFDLTFPGQLSPGSRSLSIRLAPSIAGSLFGALEFLTSYPYGCVEQTMSSFLPDLVVTQAIRDLGVKTTVDEASLGEKLHAGLERLYNFQHEDGGWGWWETDESHPFMTAYVVAGLVQAKAAGVQVKPEAIDNGVGWISKHLGANSELSADLRAYMAYALAVAGHPDAAATTAIYQSRTKLSPYGLAVLGLAMEQANDSRAPEIAGILEQGVQQNAEEAWWPATRDEMLDFSEDATPEATAYAVKFLSHQKASSALLPKAALWLMNHRNEGYWWTSTKQTAMVIYGLADYLKATHELNPNLDVTVSINGGAPITRKLDQASLSAPAELRLDESKLQPGLNHITVSAAGTGRLYYSARIEYYSTAQKLQRAGTVNLNILRDYFKLTPGKDGDRILYKADPLNGPAAAGDILAVRLTVSGSEWKYLMIEDPIPAGTEFIERDNLYQFRDRPPWWSYFFTRRELHDDRMAIFQTYFGQGQKEYFYLLKVVNPGVFQVSPARAVPMYNHDVMATTESRRLEVK